MRVLQGALVLLCVFMLGSFAHALSDEHYKRLMDNYSEFARAERHLGKVWSHIKQLVHGEAYERYHENQRRWVEEGRDRAVEHALAAYRSDSSAVPSSALKDDIFGKDQAYTLITLERAKQLNILLSQIKDMDFRLTLAGAFHKKDGHYLFTPYLWYTPFKVCSVDEFEDLPQHTRRLIHRSMENGDQLICTANLRQPDTFDMDRNIEVKPLPEGMGWRELDQWDDF